MSDGISANPTPPYVILTGNPNCGKTTLFNALTGLRAKVGNYAGVTVERKEGRLLGAPTDMNIRVLDLPGTYSLSPNSLDEQISRDVLLNRLPELPPPDLIVVVVDASNLQRNLYYATQVIELGHPTIIALNMVDVAENNGHRIDAEKLAEALGVPVLPVVASTGQGVPELKRKIIATLNSDWEERPVADPKISGTATRHPSQLILPVARAVSDRGDRAGRSAGGNLQGTAVAGHRGGVAHSQQRKGAGIEQGTLSAKNPGRRGRRPQTARSERH